MTKTHESHEEHAVFERPSHHARIMRGIVAPVFGLLAVACVVFGTLNATIWRPSSEIAASVNVSGRYAMTDPGVLSMVAERSTLVVHAKSSKTRVCIALSTRKDAAGWLAGSTYTRITGMSDWQTLTTSSQKTAGSATAQDSSVEFESSDMWRSVKCGTGNVSLTSRATSSDVIALIDTGSNSSRTSVTIHWVREKLPDFATPFYFIAGLLALMTVLSASVFAMPDVKRRKTPGKPKPKDPDEISFSEAFAGSWSIIKRTFTPRKSNKPRKRHAPGAPAQSAFDRQNNHGEDVSSPDGNGSVAAEPVVVDPMSRNLVADMQQRTGADQPVLSVAAVQDSSVERAQATENPPVAGVSATSDEAGETSHHRHGRHSGAEHKVEDDRHEASAPVAFQPHHHSRHARHEGQPQAAQEQPKDVAHSYASLHVDQVWYPGGEIDFGSAGQFEQGEVTEQPQSEGIQASDAAQRHEAENHAPGDTSDADESHPTALRHARTNAPAPVNAEATSVIDPKELQAYFARWASQQETTDQDDSDDDNHEESKE
ncbi:hypothetical protein [Bifidobacterium apri]|nr:hypothetical protein [Bifidobacterium apri]